MSLVARYFERRRGAANAFCLSGTGAAGIVMPFLVEYWLRAYDLQGTLIILSACTLQLMVSGALYRPLETHVRITNKEKEAANCCQPGCEISKAKNETAAPDAASVCSSGRAAAAAAASVPSQNLDQDTPFHFRNESFNSLPCSLPAHLEYQFPFHHVGVGDNSSEVSREGETLLLHRQTF